MNTFNEIQRYSILEELWKNIELLPLWYYNFRNMMVSGFIGLGYGPFMKAATYQMDEGVKQGDMEAMPNFCIGINQANKTTYDLLLEKGGIILSDADDTYIHTRTSRDRFTRSQARKARNNRSQFQLQ